MIERTANQLALAIKRANPENTASVEVLKFALIMVIGTGSAIFLSLLVSFMFGTFLETITVLISFALLRAFSGGFHYKSAELCTLTSALGAIAIPFIPVSNQANIVLTLLSLMIIFIFAPCGINQSKFFKSEHYLFLKILSACIVSINLILSSSILALSFSAQALTIIVFKVRERR